MSLKQIPDRTRDRSSSSSPAASHYVDPSSKAAPAETTSADQQSSEQATAVSDRNTFSSEPDADADYDSDTQSEIAASLLDPASVHRTYPTWEYVPSRRTIRPVRPISPSPPASPVFSLAALAEVAAIALAHAAAAQDTRERLREIVFDDLEWRRKHLSMVQYYVQEGQQYRYLSPWSLEKRLQVAKNGLIEALATYFELEDLVEVQIAQRLRYLHNEIGDWQKEDFVLEMSMLEEAQRIRRVDRQRHNDVEVLDEYLIFLTAKLNEEEVDDPEAASITNLPPIVRNKVEQDEYLRARWEGVRLEEIELCPSCRSEEPAKRASDNSPPSVRQGKRRKMSTFDDDNDDVMLISAEEYYESIESTKKSREKVDV
ncbi:hypothetical protein K491DRAFT_683637 [Lophiostoma macrostomum CBS 122681]|uniref:Uncharacterized protein n=1 Tax=Lophiostoma macrostomum CBS 122681 TaxID=1314788 RepID=A0A6A6SU22_9PLEO|nr:hypothetical protein K491DRAFT_683637 [Lophiostoma macrostomum CBS 122681]